MTGAGLPVTVCAGDRAERPGSAGKPVGKPAGGEGKPDGKPTKSKRATCRYVRLTPQPPADSVTYRVATGG
ncbi:hypothetical protein ACFV5M_12050 [Streptomyces albidoflavus]